MIVTRKPMADVLAGLPEGKDLFLNATTLKRALSFERSMVSLLGHEGVDRLYQDQCNSEVILVDGVPRLQYSLYSEQYMPWLSDFTLYTFGSDWVQVIEAAAPSPCFVSKAVQAAEEGDSCRIEVATLPWKMENLPYRKRKDIERGNPKKLQPVVCPGFPGKDVLLAGARRWLDHDAQEKDDLGGSAHAFICQWSWAFAAGCSFEVSFEDQSFWFGFVLYTVEGKNFIAYTAYIGPEGTGLGARALAAALEYLSGAYPASVDVLLTNPAPFVDDDSYAVKYETYKRRCSTGSIPARNLRSLKHEPIPPYLDLITGVYHAD